MDKEFANDRYPLYPSVAEMMRRKLFRMRFMNKPVLFLGSVSVNRTNLNKQWLDEINSKIIADKAIYRTPIIPAIHDTANENKPRLTNLELGVYDPLLLLTKQPLITTEHIFTDMISVLNGTLKKDFGEVIGRHHNAIVTMEPWKDGIIEKDPAILTNTFNGHYDKVWTKLYEIISNVPQTVYLRWGHEMEIPIQRYAWQSMDPVAYIKAFRYFATFQKPKANNIKLVWGPAGDRGSVEWWPGEDVVDFVSFAVYGLPDKNINDYNKQKSFSSIFQTKFNRMRFTHRPIFVTEFGVKGPEAYQKKWILEAASIINKYPEVKGVSYFNFADTPKAWGDAETPDWSITDSTFKSFIKVIYNLHKN
jgi:beta-mannanase